MLRWQIFLLNKFIVPLVPLQLAKCEVFYLNITGEVRAINTKYFTERLRDKACFLIILTHSPDHSKNCEMDFHKRAFIYIITAAISSGHGPKMLSLLLTLRPQHSYEQAQLCPRHIYTSLLQRKA
jgi:hypothetical protein